MEHTREPKTCGTRDESKYRFRSSIGRKSKSEAWTPNGLLRWAETFLDCETNTGEEGCQKVASTVRILQALNNSVEHSWFMMMMISTLVHIRERRRGGR